MMRLTFFATATLVVLFLTGCADGTGPARAPAAPTTGEVSFDYSGIRSGQFMADGEIPDDTLEMRSGSWGAARLEIFREDSVLVIAAMEVTDYPIGRGLKLEFSPAEPGDYALYPFCDGPPRCMMGIFVLDEDLRSTDATAFMASEGSVTLTELTDDHVAGTFELVLQGFHPITGDSVGTVVVENGQFRVPLLDPETDMPSGY